MHSSWYAVGPTGPKPLTSWHALVAVGSIEFDSAVLDRRSIHTARDHTLCNLNHTPCLRSQQRRHTRGVMASANVCWIDLGLAPILRAQRDVSRQRSLYAAVVSVC